MRRLFNVLLSTPLPLITESAAAHSGHGIEYSLTSLIVLVVFVIFLSMLYDKR